MRFLSALLVLPLAGAAILPDSIGTRQRGTVQPVAIAAPDRPVFDEYGFQDGETAKYGAITATAWRFQDSTGALAAFEAQRPAGWQPSKLGKLAVEGAEGALIARGNYLLLFRGEKPTLPEIDPVIEGLPNLEQSPLPTWIDYLPAQGITPNSERYILGPASLEKFFPGVPASLAAFRMGAEAIAGTYGDTKMAIFNYPTPQIAIERFPEFQKAAGLVAKRAGPMIAVIVAPKDPNAAEKLLSLVRYQPQITWSERVPTRKDNIGNLILNAFLLIAILLGFALVAGLSYGGMRVLRRRFGKLDENEQMIVLHIEH